MATSNFVLSLLRSTNAGGVLRNMRTGAVVADHVLAAVDSKARRTGLLGRSSFPPGHAMVIAPSNAVHTCLMRFPIDIIFVNRQGHVLKTKSDVRPWRIAAATRAFAVIELAAGTLTQTEVRVGDSLQVAPAIVSCPD